MSAWLQVVLFALGARLGFDCDAARARLGSTPLDDGSVFRGLRPLFGPRFRWADSAPVPGSLLSDGSGWAPGGRLDPPSAGGFSGGVGGRRFREACGGLGCVSMAAPFFAASRPLPDASPRPHPPAARAGVFGQVKVSEMVKGAFRFGKRKFSEMVRPTGRAPTPAPPTVRTSYR